MHGEREKRRRKLYEILADLCEVPPETVTDIPVFVLRGKHELEIEGCTGVREYTAGRIVLAVKKELFTVTGEKLELTDFSGDTLYIRGVISGMKYGSE